MGRPVIIDDGGSIRIRLFEKSGPGKMGDLLNVNNKTAEQDIVDPTEDYRQALVTWAKDDGTAGQEAIDLKAGMTLFDDLNEFKIVVSADKKRLKITISGTDVSPNVKEAQHNSKFSYTISNAGRVNRIQEGNNPVKGPFIYANVVIIQPLGRMPAIVGIESEAMSSMNGWVWLCLAGGIARQYLALDPGTYFDGGEFQIMGITS